MELDIYAWKMPQVAIQVSKLSSGRVVLEIGKISIFLDPEQAEKIEAYMRYLAQDSEEQADYIKRLKSIQK